MKIKKILAAALALAMALSLAACGSSTDSDEPAQEETVAEEQPSDETAAEDPSSGETTAEDTAPEGQKVLILYFSAANTKDTDAVSSATPMAGDVSSTRWIAEIVHGQMGGDIEAIVPSVDYPLSYNECADYAKDEANNDARPAFEPLSVDPAEYDVIFIGYPIWWYELPMVLETFFDTYDLSGKTIVPFMTHGGSRDGGTFQMIQEREPGATVLDGIAVSGTAAGSDSARQDVLDWLNTLGLK
ncbi:MAG: NAD(P)H-dependent oxidoreductase [Mogibacterium sp.]|nr:NAD(P)H-dependent oxidoreductase [Mogibacterium sp.]